MKLGIALLSIVAVLLIIGPVSASVLNTNITSNAYFDRAWNDTFYGHRNAPGDHVTVQNAPTTQLYALITANDTTPYLMDFRFSSITIPTSSIGSGSVVTAGTVTGHATNVRTGDLGHMSYTLIDFSPANGGGTVLSTDYNRTTFTQCSDEISYDAFATPNATITWTLNTAGLARVNKTGNTTFLIVSNWTLQNPVNTPQWVYPGESRVGIRSMAYGSGVYTPSASITYTTSGSLGSIATYPVRINATRYLPNSDSNLPASGLNLAVNVTPGDYEPVSFVMKPSVAVTDLNVVASDLTYGTLSIPGSNVDVRTVKAWYQSNINDLFSANYGWYLTPELLLKNDSIVQVNYATQQQTVWIKNSTYEGTYHIDNTTAASASKLPVDAQIYDTPASSGGIVPFALPANENKQMWLTVHVPTGTQAGVYNGTVTISASTTSTVVMNLSVTVLPYTLPASSKTYGVYYYGRVAPSGTATPYNLGKYPFYKTTAQYTYDMQDMYNHGVYYPTVSESIASGGTALGTALQIRNSTGFPTDKLFMSEENLAYYLRLSQPTTNAQFNALQSQVLYVKNAAAAYGIQNIYSYGWDEPHTTAQVQLSIPALQVMKGNGSKTWASDGINHPDSALPEAPYLDVINLAGNGYGTGYNATRLALWKAANPYIKVYSYANPQAGVENFELNRNAYGFRLYQSGYDGAIDFNFYDEFGNTIWNDYDDRNGVADGTWTARDHAFAYPTTNGNIPTVQWEGFRQAINDERYAEKLTAVSGSSTLAMSDVNTLLAAGVDSAVIRSTMIGQISNYVVVTPVSSFFMNATGASISYGSGTTYEGHTIGGNYNGASDYPTYGAGYDANPADGGYMGTTVTTKLELITALNGAHSGDVVYVSGTANIDMGNTINTPIPAGVTLASNRGSGGSLGGRIYSTVVGSAATTGSSEWEQPIFVTSGNNVKLTGIRLEGESYPMDYDIGDESQEAKLRVGIKIYHTGVVISNCDLKGFGYADVASFNIPTSGRPVINYSYIHESQNQHEGYGMEIDGGDALLYANIFYKNRHDVTGVGVTGEKYTVHNNRFLDTGTWDVMGAAHVDAHGQVANDEAYSGARYEVYQNSFEGGHNVAVHQRGLPSDGMYIYNNDILVDGAYTGSNLNYPIYQTYQNVPGYGNVYVTYNRYKGTVYNGGQGIFEYQSYNGATWILSTDPGIPSGSSDLSNLIDPASVTFTDTTTGSPVSWNWLRTNIATGGSASSFSTSRTPGYVTFHAGNWSIQLLTANAIGVTNTSPANVSWVNVSGAVSPPASNFTATPTTLTAGTMVQFNDTSTGGATGWGYAFDTYPSTGQLFYFIGNSQNSTWYPQPGNWTIRQVVTNSGGQSVSVKTNYIHVTGLVIQPPVANFTPRGYYYPSPSEWMLEIQEGTNITFMDASTGGASTAWNWSFQKIDGTWLYYDTKNVTLVINATTFGAGRRQIFYTVSNSAGNSTTLNSYFYIPNPPVKPIAQFNATNLNTGQQEQYVRTGSYESIAAEVGHVVRLMDTSYNNPTDVYFTIDNGNGSTLATRKNPGEYIDIAVSPWMIAGGNISITFRATNAAGSDEFYKPDFIRIADLSPPESVTSITNQTGVDTVVWNFNGLASDVTQVRMWKNGVLYGNATTNSSTWAGLTPSTSYEIATKTVDAAGNVNDTFVNKTTTTLGTTWTITSDQSWVAPVGVTRIMVQMTGGGGSGAGSYTSTPSWSYAGLAGNPGEAQTYIVDVVPTYSYPITIGLRGENKSSTSVSNITAVGNSGTSTEAFGHIVQGGLGGRNRFNDAEPHGGNATDGVWSTVRFALNGTGETSAGGTSGLGYGAPGGGAGTYATIPTVGGHGAGGVVIITDLSYSSSVNKPDFVADITSSGPGTLIHFTDLSTITDTAGLTYNWSFGDMSTSAYSSTIGNVMHVYSYTGSYDVSLTLTTANGTITETKPTYINIYNDQGRMKVTYPPKDVRFHIQTIWGEAIPDVKVTAVASQTSLGNYSYVASLFGYALEDVPLDTLVLNGTTDSRGDITFAVMTNVQYAMTFTKTGYTFDDITLAPYDVNLIYPTSTGSAFVKNGTAPQANVIFTAQTSRYNQTVALLTVNYTDTTSATTGGIITLTQPNASAGNTSIVTNTLFSVPFTGNTSSTSYLLIDAPTSNCPSTSSAIITTSGATVLCTNNILVNDQSYVSGAVGNNAYGELTVQSPIWFKNIETPLNGLSPIFSLFFALGVMMFTALMATGGTAPAISLCVTFEGWIFYGMNCFQSIDRPLVTMVGTQPTVIGDSVVVAVLTFMTMVCFVYLFVSYRRSGK